MKTGFSLFLSAARGAQALEPPPLEYVLVRFWPKDLFAVIVEIVQSCFSLGFFMLLQALITAEVERLKALKNEYKATTGVEWVPEPAGTAPAPGAAPAAKQS